jgi:hypothetical protein
MNNIMNRAVSNFRPRSWGRVDQMNIRSGLRPARSTTVTVTRRARAGPRRITRSRTRARGWHPWYTLMVARDDRHRRRDGGRAAAAAIIQVRLDSFGRVRRRPPCHSLTPRRVSHLCCGGGRRCRSSELPGLLTVQAQCLSRARSWDSEPAPSQSRPAPWPSEWSRRSIQVAAEFRVTRRSHDRQYFKLSREGAACLRPPPTIWPQQHARFAAPADTVA